ncbi:uncharacterized protein LOC132936184 [Metopolophium dirhodum]|uniref:uncharacterized protein LOC132936184 n=1 Tax=Metopolophium dirhodum TaxID=44670 RepID=UPI00298FCEF6|nr:uncharacterized protein LOC132936184 [Metopolophium dirhodum]
MDVKPHTSNALITAKKGPYYVKEEPDVKETFVKRVKRRGRPKLVSQQTPFCPPFMVRCDNDQSHFNYRTVWACRICTKILLSKAAAISHAAICKLAITKEEDIPIADLNYMEKNMCYPCKYCDKKMRRKVIWLKHLNEHETPDYDENNWGVDDILIANLKQPDKVVSKQMKQEPDFNPSTL